MAEVSPQIELSDSSGAVFPVNLVHLNAATYAAKPGDMVICDYNGLQTITLPTVFNVGDQVAVVRGNTTQDIHVVPGAGATIGGQPLFRSKADLVATIYGATFLVKALSVTLWVPIIQESFWSDLAGSGLQLGDIMVQGTLYLPFNVWLNNVVSTAVAAAVTSASLVIVTTGAGVFNLTADTTIGANQVVWIKNNSAGIVTFVPNTTGTVDGNANLAIAPSTGVMLVGVGGGSSGSGGGAHVNWVSLLKG